MTDAMHIEPSRQSGESGRSLKDQNRWQLWMVVAAETLVLYGVIQANAIKADGLRSILTDAQNLLPVGFALVGATVLNGLLSADMKARLVFLRWHYGLPGHRAFTKYAVRDPRIDLAALEKLHGGPLPAHPVEQNRAWYRLYKSVENDHAVKQVHRDFLLMRDYTGLCAVFIVFFGRAGLYAIPSTKTGWTYLLVLVAQFLIVRQAASNCGARMVTTVMARRAAKEVSDTTTTPRQKTRTARARSDVKKPER